VPFTVILGKENTICLVCLSNKTFRDKVVIKVFCGSIPDFSGTVFTIFAGIENFAEAS
jgi:hypothetical protein